MTVSVLATAELPTPDPVETRGVSEHRAARASLRAQITRLERELGSLAVELASPGRWLALPADPRTGPASVSSHAGSRGLGGRLLTLGELETIRDALIRRVRAGQRVLEQRVDAEERGRARLERILAEPAAHRFEIVSRAELGEPGCGAYQVRPCSGLLGMLLGWWRVKLSSGCPLPGGIPGLAPRLYVAHPASGTNHRHRDYTHTHFSDPDPPLARCHTHVRCADPSQLVFS